MESRRTIANPVPTSEVADYVGGTSSNRPELVSVSLVSRFRLVEMIDGTGLEPITTVVAPAGYGKSTLVAQWMAQSRNRVCWVSLAPGDNSVDRILEHLRHATQCDLPIAYPLPDNALAVIVALLDAGASLSSDVVIVLDDVHLIENPTVHDLMNALARRWADQTHLSSAGWSRVFGELDARLVRARLYLAEHNPRGALALLQVVVDEAVVTRRHAELVRAYTHTAIARAMLADMPGAAAELSKAIRWGKHGRFIRSFVIPNHELLPVFQYLNRGLRDSDYVQQLEEELRTVSPNISQAYVSERERDVLELAASAFTNQRIADRLFISELTVKKHLVNINGKLGTKNRTQATLRARELGII